MTAHRQMSLSCIFIVFLIVLVFTRKIDNVLFPVGGILIYIYVHWYCAIIINLWRSLHDLWIEP